MCSFFYTIFILFFQGSTMGDVGVAVCCGACGLCQTAVEVQERGDHQWWYGELSKWSLNKIFAKGCKISFWSFKFNFTTILFDYSHFC